jgi:hypothetical protein
MYKKYNIQEFLFMVFHQLKGLKVSLGTIIHMYNDNSTLDSSMETSSIEAKDLETPSSRKASKVQQ